MVEIDQVMADEELKSKLAAIGAGVLVIIAGFLVYNYFSKVGKEEGVLKEEAALLGEMSEVKVPLEEEELGETTPKVEQEGFVPEATGEGTEGEEASTAAWVATDYTEGDIGGVSHTVRAGDTLWEIAEARYGSGFEWAKILEANKDAIGFLPNGSQALIVPGQVLSLP